MGRLCETAAAVVGCLTQAPHNRIFTSVDAPNARPQTGGTASRPGITRCPHRIASLLLAAALLPSPAPGAHSPPAERSFWIHASLGLFTQRGYFGANYPATDPPRPAQIANAARLLRTSCAANRLYLIYHRELPADDARGMFLCWRQSCPEDIEIVPALVLSMYDGSATPVFPRDELDALARFFRDEINPRCLAVYDIASRRTPADALAPLARIFPGGLIRLGLQPAEPIEPPFAAAIADTWSALCHGKDNDKDWAQPGFGAATLRQWVLDRNSGTRPVAWNLVTVAWDYSATDRGGYPGYDDAEKNMPLPAGRNRAALQIIRAAARPAVLAGFSSDLYILHENSRAAIHDGRDGSLYECLKRGEDYRGFYAAPFREIAALYRELGSARP